MEHVLRYCDALRRGLDAVFAEDGLDAGALHDH
jgi:hypothetical protein